MAKTSAMLLFNHVEFPFRRSRCSGEKEEAVFRHHCRTNNVSQHFHERMWKLPSFSNYKIIQLSKWTFFLLAKRKYELNQNDCHGCMSMVVKVQAEIGLQFLDKSSQKGSTIVIQNVENVLQGPRDRINCHGSLFLDFEVRSLV
ncbi:hypothetical protein Fmac_031795 [Flemingia macrophylla]|uniref:Uncharacterized protein n=1 Tax=Flemingia macrophylla TaxID=520843 RepID=A0ABD1L331_9FABA